MSTQRELKFRVWHEYTDDPELNQMIMLEPTTGSYDYEDGIVLAFSVRGYPEFGAHERRPIKEPERVTFMQFTGLRDRKGREIYEGDVLRKMGLDYGSDEYSKWAASDYEGPEPEHVELKRDVCTMEAFRYWLKTESFGYEGEDMESPNEWEIIGNVWENPELIPA